jgi:hypothetical protein
MAALSVFSLAACVGVGVVDPPDPMAKLNDASYLYQERNRPVPAETLIAEATVIFQQRNDPHGLGNASREYADFLRSAALVNWQAAYRNHVFSDASVTYDNRLEKASEYYAKALTYYGLAETQELAAGKYDALTNVYYNMAMSKVALGAPKDACVDLERALQA